MQSATLVPITLAGRNVQYLGSSSRRSLKMAPFALHGSASTWLLADHEVPGWRTIWSHVARVVLVPGLTRRQRLGNLPEVLFPFFGEVAYTEWPCLGGVLERPMGRRSRDDGRSFET